MSTPYISPNMTVANRIDRYPTTFYSVINGQGSKRPSITTIYDFCMGVGMTLEEFFARKEFENLYD